MIVRGGSNNWLIVMNVRVTFPWRRKRYRRCDKALLVKHLGLYRFLLMGFLGFAAACWLFRFYYRRNFTYVAWFILCQKSFSKPSVFLPLWLIFNSILCSYLPSWKIFSVHLGYSHIWTFKIIIADKSMPFAGSIFSVSRYFYANNHSKMAKGLTRFYILALYFLIHRNLLFDLLDIVNRNLLDADHQFVVLFSCQTISCSPRAHTLYSLLE